MSGEQTRQDPAGHYPRPLLRRAEWTDLCGPWEFAYDDDQVGLAEAWYRDGGAFDRTITVPYPPESAASGVGETGFHPVVWYRRRLRLAPADLTDGRRALLHFGAVDYHATVWLDGQRLGDHEGGMTPFTVDVTDAVRHAGGGEHTLVVRVEDRPEDVTQPRGKQDWQVEPHAIWYHRTTGIWQPVWLEVVPAVHLTAVCWTPDLAAAEVRLEATVAGLRAGGADAATLRVRLRHGEEVLAEQATRVTDAETVLPLHLPALRHGQDRERLLWSPEQPTLVDAEVELVDEATGAVDRVASYVGLRSVGTADGRFLLNDRPYYLRLVLEQGYWPQSHLAAPDAAALRREVELIKELGFNGARVHQKVEDPRFLYWCDRLGLLVWGEMAGAYAFTQRAMARFTAEWTAVVRRDRGHPSVVTWVPFNESWGVQDIARDRAQRDFVRGVVHLTRAIDPTRPVVSNDGWEQTDADLWTVHDYAGTGEELRARYAVPGGVAAMLTAGRPGGRRVLLDGGPRGGRPDRPVVLSEFGGLSYRPARDEKWFGYSTVTGPEELADRLADLVGAVLDAPDLAGFCYTQLTDTEQETNGLLTADRRPKLPPERLRGVFGRPATALLTDALHQHQREVYAETAGEPAE